MTLRARMMDLCKDDGISTVSQATACLFAPLRQRSWSSLPPRPVGVYNQKSTERVYKAERVWLLAKDVEKVQRMQQERNARVSTLEAQPRALKVQLQAGS